MNADAAYLKAMGILDKDVADESGKIKPNAAMKAWLKGHANAQASFEAADNRIREAMNIAANLGKKDREEFFRKLQRDIQVLQDNSKRLMGDGVQPNRELKARIDKEPGAEKEFLLCNDEIREFLNTLALLPESFWRSVYEAYQSPRDGKCSS